MGTLLLALAVAHCQRGDACWPSAGDVAALAADLDPSSPRHLVYMPGEPRVMSVRRGAEAKGVQLADADSCTCKKDTTARHKVPWWCGKLVVQLANACTCKISTTARHKVPWLWLCGKRVLQRADACTCMHPPQRGTRCRD